ncbi:hypothetical protein SAMN05216328_1701 [Ensifer sp. YR511]|nr:hypothetical protein SAMN05216328_1701 [Ensifer sp. YR511]
MSRVAWSMCVTQLWRSTWSDIDFAAKVGATLTAAAVCFDLAPKFYPVLSSLQRFLVSVFAAVAAGCGAEPFRLRSTASRRGLIV